MNPIGSMKAPPSAARSGNSSSLAHEANYSTGEPAVRLDTSGCGFCYDNGDVNSYLSGRVAACANKVSEYQRSFQFYEDNAKRTLLGNMDEHAVRLSISYCQYYVVNCVARGSTFFLIVLVQIGSAGHPHRKKLILTKESGIIMTAENVIVKSWKWDPKAQHAGTPPTEAVVIQLNESLVFTYRDRSSISVTFTPCPGISVSFACGEQLRRTDTYLEHAHRITEGPQRGKLLIDQRAPTILQRQKLIEFESIEKRSKQKPHSADLSHEKLKAIVSDLESKFDGYEGCRVTPAADGNWRENAHQQCLREIPVLPRTGHEVGQEPTLFGAPVKENDSSESLKRLKHEETGKWLGSVEVHNKITAENPVLKRGSPLTSASGRYSRELAVLGGGAKPNGEHLRLLSALRLDEFLKETSKSDQLIVIACLRTDDCQSRIVEATLEHIQLQISESKRASATLKDPGIRHKCHLVKCDLGESPLLAERYRIHATPTFLMFYEGRLVHVTSLGGAAVRVAPTTKNAHLFNQMDQLPRVLLVEKNVKQQVAIEKILKKEAFQWDLANHGEQAVSYFTRLPRSTGGPTQSTSTGYRIVMLSDTLEDFEVRSIDRFVRHKEKSKPAQSLVRVIVSSPLGDVQFASSMCTNCRRSHGRRISSASIGRKRTDGAAFACPHCGILSEETTVNLLPAVLADVGHVFVYKHVKAATMHRLAEMWSALRRPANSDTSGGTLPLPPWATASTSKPGDSDGSFVGLTVDSFFKEMEKDLATGKRGVFLPEYHVPAMALSANDTVLTSGALSSSNQASSGGMPVGTGRE